MNQGRNYRPQIYRGQRWSDRGTILGERDNELLGPVAEREACSVSGNLGRKIINQCDGVLNEKVESWEARIILSERFAEICK